MNRDPESTQILLKKMMEGMASESEEKELRLALRQYKDEEINEMLANIANEINHNYIGKTDLPTLSFNDWKKHTKKRNATFLKKILPYGIGFLLLSTASIWFLQNKNESLKCNMEQEEEIPANSSTVQLTLSNENSKQIEKNYIGQIAIDGSMEIIRRNEGSIEYKKINNAGMTISNEKRYNIIQTSYGQYCTVKFPNGCLIRLNSASAIRFPIPIEGDTQIIHLVGEAIFDIPETSTMTFNIQTQTAKFITTGSTVNIRTYNQDQTIATVLKGLVNVPNRQKPILLRPGEQATIHVIDENIESIDIIPNADTSQAITWKNKLRIYNNISVQNFLIEMARQYNLEMRCLENLPQKNISIKFCIESNVNSLYRLFDKLNLRYSIKDGVIVFCKT